MKIIIITTNLTLILKSKNNYTEICINLLKYSLISHYTVEGIKKANESRNPLYPCSLRYQLVNDCRNLLLIKVTINGKLLKIPVIDNKYNELDICFDNAKYDTSIIVKGEIFV